LLEDKIRIVIYLGAGGSDMTILTVIDGQLILSEDVLKHLKLEAGDKVAVDFLPDGKLELTAVDDKKSDLESFFGSLHDPNGPVLSIEEIKRITEDAWAGKR
jgi:hypothetical protein